MPKTRFFPKSPVFLLWKNKIMPLCLRFLKRYNRRNKVNNSLGFTLTELLVVVMIIGILVAVALPAFIRMIAQGETVECTKNTTHLAHRQREYYTENLSFTKDLNQLELMTKDSDRYNYSIMESPIPEYEGVAHIGNAKNPALGGCFTVVYVKNGEPKMCTANQIWSMADILNKDKKIKDKCQ